jgi:hypothetical protein
VPFQGQAGSNLRSSASVSAASGESPALAATAASEDALALAKSHATATATEEEVAADAALAIVEEQPVQDKVYKAEPLHVRYLCRAEHRRTTGQIVSEEQKLEDMQKELDGLRGVSTKRSDDSKMQQLESDKKRMLYQIKLRKDRMDRLVAINPRTHEEMPEKLIDAARDGDTDFVRLAYDAKVDVNVQHKELRVTPLIMATIANKVTVVKLLLDLQANPRIQDINGATCVHYAVQLDHVHVLATLMDANPGKDWDTLTQKDAREMSPVDYARRPERSGCLRLMQNRLGGPIPVVWQVFKGWLSDKTGCCRPQINKRKGCC